MVIEQGLFADQLAGQGGLDLVGLDRRQEDILVEELLEFAEGGAVICEGVDVEPARLGGEFVAGDGLGKGKLLFHPGCGR